VNIISGRRKSKAESQPTASKTRPTRRRPIEAALLHCRLLRVKATELPRRRFLHLAGGAAAVSATSGIAMAQAYPLRPITMIVPITPGGLIDAVARIVAEGMRQSLGQSIVIENAPGADGTIGTGRAARARPDGYTIEYGSLGTHVLNGAFYSPPYDVLNDFAPITPLVTNPGVIYARKTMPGNDLNELIAWLKANPGKASAGIVSGEVRLITAFFQKETGTQLNLVPYRGGAPATQDMMSGQIDLLIGGGTVLLTLVRAGSIKAYAVTSERRLAVAPEVPTVFELGLPALSFSAWSGIFAPKGTPGHIINKLNTAAAEALTDPARQSRLADLAVEVFPRERQTPDSLAALQKADAEKWWPIIKEFGLRAE
jgi:tripartite-type tricarboxylate transporter receptor subunit TctC